MKKARFTKSDLDIVAAKYREMGKWQVKETVAEEGMMDDLAVLDWGVLMAQVLGWHALLPSLSSAQPFSLEGL